MQDKKYKAGLIGYGYWGPVLLRNFSLCDRFEVIKVCDRHQAKLAKVREIESGIVTCLDYNEIIKDENIDVVIIAAQAGSHYQFVREALNNNKHVFVEKPLALNSIEARDLIALNKKRKLVIMVDHTFLFTPQYQEVKRLVDDGLLGRIMHFHSTRADFGLFQKDANILWQLLYHDAYIILDLFKHYKIKSVRASGFSHIIDKIEDTAYVSVLFEGGMSVEVLVNMLFPTKERKIIISGDKNILQWIDNADEKLKLYHRSAFYDKNDLTVKYAGNEEIELLPLPKTEALRTEVDYFADCLMNEVSPINDETAALRVIELLERMTLAMRKAGDN